jgi:hypothetical protein
MFLNDSGYAGKTFMVLLITAIASISASLPVLGLLFSYIKGLLQKQCHKVKALVLEYAPNLLSILLTFILLF